jgi:molybdopterin molybdotransferase
MAVPAHSGGSGSHLVTSLSEADGYAEVPEETTSVAAGDVLTVRWL